MGRRLYLVGLAVLFWSSLYLYVPVLAPYVERMGGSLADTGVVLAAYGLTQLLFRLPLGIWSDRQGRRKRFVIVGAAAAGLSGLGFAVAQTPWQATVCRAMAGVAATTWVTFTPLIAAAWPGDQGTRAMGAAYFASMVGQLVAMPVGGWLARAAGWHVVFLVAGALGFLAMVAGRWLPEGQPGPVAVNRESWRHLSHPSLLTPSLLAALTQYLLHATALGFTNVHAVRLGATATELGYLGAAAALPAAIAAVLVAHALAARLGTWRVVAAGFLADAAVAAWVPLVHDIRWLIVAQACGSVARGIVLPVLMGEAMAAVPQSLRAGGMGVYQSVYAAGMMAGPLLSGRVGSIWGLDAVFWTASCLGGLGGLAALLLPRWGARRAEAEPAKGSV